MRRTAIAALLPAAAAAAALPAGAEPADLRRAAAPRPPAGSPLSAATPDAAFAAIAAALRGGPARTRRCDEWDLRQLDAVADALLDRREPALDAFYRSKVDKRALHFAPGSGYKDGVRRSEAALAPRSAAWNRTRDGKCAEAAMWWAHHLPAAARRALAARAGFAVPEPPAHLVAAPKGAEYGYQVTCGSCHVLVEDDHPLPAPRHEKPCPKHAREIEDLCHGKSDVWYEGMRAPVGTRLKRADSCYEPFPAPCEGVGGIIWGDHEGEFNPTRCEVVAGPDEVPRDNLTTPTWPEQFIVDEHAILINQVDYENPSSSGRFPGAEPCAEHVFENATYTLFYDGSRTTGPRLRTDGSNGHIWQRTDGNMFIKAPPLLGVEMCICVGPTENGAPRPAPVISALRHDFLTDAQLVGRERIFVEYLDITVLADHWVKGPHHHWIEVATNRMIRGWQPYNGLNIWYNWRIGAPPEERFTVDTSCYEGLFRINVTCRAGPPETK